MKLTTPVTLTPSWWKINYQDHVMMLGSCFASEMVGRLKDDGIRVDGGAFGVQYNPLSINKGLTMLWEKKQVQPEVLFEHEGLWHSWDFDSNSSGYNPEETCNEMNKRIKACSEGLHKANVLVITWGTNRCYLHHGEVVNNCHKVPAKEFVEHDATMEEIVENTTTLFYSLFAAKPDLHVILTVSPIRYPKYGMHGSQLSKATLLLAAEALQQAFPHRVDYFPAYEILMDELRDYRFYAEDMVHPSKLAVDIIYERFAQCYFDEATHQQRQEHNRLAQARNHVPRNPDSPEYKKFTAKLEADVAAYEKKWNKLF